MFDERVPSRHSASISKKINTSRRYLLADGVVKGSPILLRPRHFRCSYNQFIKMKVENVFDLGYLTSNFNNLNFNNIVVYYLLQ